MRALIQPGVAGQAAVNAAQQRLSRLGVADVRVVAAGTTPEQLAALAAGLEGRTLILDADLIVADACLGQLVDDPSVRSGALVAPGAPAPGAAGVRVTHRRIASVATDVHDVTSPNAAFLGACVVAAEDVAAARQALGLAARLAGEYRWAGNPVDLALVALVRSQVPMGLAGAVGPVLRGGSAQERSVVLEDLAGIDEARVLLERANRPDDGFYSTFVLRRASKPVTSLALRWGLTPNQISLVSLGVGLLGAACFAIGSWPALLAGALLMQASLIIDCVDGEVARFTRSFSQLGAWIDASTDRVKEYAAYAGLAAGAARTGQDIWLLAALVMIMQTVRHIGDYDFSRVQRVRESWVAPTPLDQRGDAAAAGTGATLELSAQLNRSGPVRWVKKVLHMPIGERWLVLSVGVVTIGPRATLLLMLALGLLALTYTTLGRILRTRSWNQPADRSGDGLLEPQLDLGPLGEPVWRGLRPRRPLARPFGWAWPAVMRLVELSIVWVAVAVVAPDLGPWLFAWVFVVVFHHYDSLYRALGGSAPPSWLVMAGLGWDGRTVVVVCAAALGGVALATVLGWGALLLGFLFVIVASVQWIRSLTREDVSHA